MTTTQTIELNREEIYEDEDKSCDNCKHHLKFMCKNWRTCHDYSDWELEELDFVQPHKTIPCKIKVVDGEYISRQAVLDAVDKVCRGSVEYRVIYDRCEELIKAIPSAEPYKGMTNGEVITKILKDAEWAELSSDFGLSQEDTIYIKVGGYWWNSPYEPQEGE